MAPLDPSSIRHHAFDASVYPHGVWQAIAPESSESLAEEKLILAAGQSVVRMPTAPSPKPAEPAKALVYIVAAVVVVGAVLFVPQATKAQEGLTFLGALFMALNFVYGASMAFRSRPQEPTHHD